MKDRKFYVYTLPGAEFVATLAVPEKDEGTFVNLGEGEEQLTLVAEMLASDHEEATIRYLFSYIDKAMRECTDKTRMQQLNRARLDNWARYRRHPNGPESIRF